MNAVAPINYGPAARRSALRDYRRKQAMQAMTDQERESRTWTANASDLRADYDAMEAKHLGWF
jgi:hypothetical protein